MLLEIALRSKPIAAMGAMMFSLSTMDSGDVVIEKTLACSDTRLVGAEGAGVRARWTRSRRGVGRLEGEEERGEGREISGSPAFPGASIVFARLAGLILE